MSPLLLRCVVLVVALVIACIVGVWVRRRSGRARAVVAGDVLTAADLGTTLGERATVLQFSAAVCTPCRATRRVLDALVPGLDGVTHVELDAAERLDLARRLSVARTPTVLVLDPVGRVVARTSGAITPAQARALIEPLLAPLPDPPIVPLTARPATGAPAPSSDALGASR